MLRDEDGSGSRRWGSAGNATSAAPNPMYYWWTLDVWTTIRTTPDRLVLSSQSGDGLLLAMASNLVAKTTVFFGSISCPRRRSGRVQRATDKAAGPSARASTSTFALTLLDVRCFSCTLLACFGCQLTGILRCCPESADQLNLVCQNFT